MPKIHISPAAAALVAYRVEIADQHAHLFRVRLTLRPSASLQRVSLPVWIPGSYLVREFSKNLQNLRARQGPRALPPSQIQQLDKCSWQVACTADKPLVLTYEVYANDSSVRTAKDAVIAPPPSPTDQSMVPGSLSRAAAASWRPAEYPLPSTPATAHAVRCVSGYAAAHVPGPKG